MEARQTHIDALKCIGSQLIVLHHFSAYGPLADATALAAPALMGWLYNDARMAVQIFLVLGGYLALQSLEPLSTRPAADLARSIWRRYVRLALPFAAALLLALACAALARSWLSADFIPAAPTASQLLAHVLLLHGVLGVESLSAGIWYVAIDFQLYVLLALLLWLGARSGLRHAAVLAVMLASLFHFNRDASWDNWALYFFGSYGLGVAAHWAGLSARPRRWLGLLALGVLLALALDWRTRIALAGATALLLGLAHLHANSLHWPKGLAHALALLGRSSYALFLIHFPVLMLANALHAKLGLSGPAAGAIMLGLGWAASIALAFVFERRVEAPLGRLFSSKRPV
ncbi:MAG: acyltransferase family protein [Hylemonella sp.]|nr:acyltransferase family protein [Hylemonella sp.]